MKFFTVQYQYSAPEEELAVVRPEHRAYLDSLDELQLSGPYTDGDAGALLVFKATRKQEVEALLAEDPFMKAGFVGDFVIREWNPVLGRKVNHLI